jgi:hypothetical protein
MCFHDVILTFRYKIILIIVASANDNDYHLYIIYWEKDIMKFLYTILLLTPLIGIAADGDYTLVIKDHKFEPAELVVPAGEKVRLFVVNKDGSPEEFESYTLNREKVVAGNSTIKMYLGPLQPGRYPFIGEFNQATAQGVIVAK